MQMLNRIIPVYQKYTNEYGLKGLRARTWHLGWFIPIWKLQVIYWFGTWKRYKNHKSILYEINSIINDADMVSDRKLHLVEIVIKRDVDCGFECGYAEPYGFVPEDGCPIHD